MLSEKENEFLTHTGPGTPMGELFRRYWLPFHLAAEAPEADGAPLRVRLLSEDLLLWRDTEGRLALIQERCPHRGTSLFYGVNDQNGLRCCYHGWKFDVAGNCTDMPSDAPDSTFKERVHARAYPVIESGGALWAYMGPEEKQPAEPHFRMNTLPAESIATFRFETLCNYLQSMEGDIDTTHISTLHLRYENEKEPPEDGTDRPGYPSRALASYVSASRKYARVEVQDTDYGLRLIAMRTTPKGNQFLRINCQVIPFMTFIASQRGDGICYTSVPIDDHNCMRIGFTIRAHRPFTEEDREALKQDRMHFEADGRTRLMRPDNDYLIDRAAQKTITPSGIIATREQDAAATESMGPIMDRTQEHLYHADAAIIRYRQLLMNAARNLQEGEEPPSLDPNIPYERLRSEEIIIGPDEDPYQVACDAGEGSRSAPGREAMAAGD